MAIGMIIGGVAALASGIMGASQASENNATAKSNQKKQEKYNNVIERTYMTEASAKSAHKRLDDIELERKEESRLIKEKLDKVLEKLTNYIIEHTKGVDKSD